MTPPGHGRADVADALVGGARADALVVADRHFLAAQAERGVGNAGGDGAGHDLVLEQAGLQRGGGLLLAGSAVLVHAFARDVVALGHLLGGLQHVPVDLGLVLDQPGVGDHVAVHLLLHAGDALDATADEDVALAGDDALRRQRDGLQAAAAEAVDGHAAGGDRQPGTQGDLARDVGASGAFGVGAAHDHVVDFGRIDAGALDGGLDREAAQRGAMGHVEGALPALGQRRACGGDDDGSGHGGRPCAWKEVDVRCRRRMAPAGVGFGSCRAATDQLKVLPSAASRASSGAGCHDAASSSGLAAKRFMVCTTLYRPCVSA